MTVTTNLGLTTYNTASGSATTFLTFRLALAGASSNMTILDTFAGATSASTASLAGRVLTYVNASQISANYYEATVANITSYVTNSIINLKTNTSNTGAVTLKINSLAVVGLKKVDSTGTKVDLISGDLILNQYYLCTYDGTQYVLMGSITSGSTLNYYSGSNVISISGSVISHTTSGITSGSYDKVQVNSFGHITAGSVVNIYDSLSFIIGDGATAITTGSKGCLEVPFNFRLGSWRVVGDISGCIVVDVWKSTYAGFPPTINNTISGSNTTITITGSQKAENTTLLGWSASSISMNRGDWLSYVVTSASSMTRATVSLNGIKI